MSMWKCKELLLFMVEARLFVSFQLLVVNSLVGNIFEGQTELFSLAVCVWNTILLVSICLSLFLLPFAVMNVYILFLLCKVETTSQGENHRSYCRRSATVCTF